VVQSVKRLLSRKCLKMLLILHTSHDRSVVKILSLKTD